MLVREYLHESGMTKDDLAKFLGHQSTASVTKKMEAEMPKRWARLLDEADATSLSAVGDGDADSSTSAPNLNEENDWESVGRSGDADPGKPDGASTVVGPQKIKLTTVRGYIEQIYGGAAYIAGSRGDDIAADTITRYTPEFSEAWINYIESDPRIMEYLEKLMIGTPLGNLIGVHVIAAGSYVFARAAAREIARAYATEQEHASVNGSGDASAAHSVA